MSNKKTQKQIVDPNAIYTVNELVDILQLSRSSIYKLIRDKTLKKVEKSPGTRITGLSVLAFLHD